MKGNPPALRRPPRPSAGPNAAPHCREGAPHLHVAFVPLVDGRRRRATGRGGGRGTSCRPNGAYTLTGDGDDGEATVEAGSSVVLDPDRLTAASGEWTLTRPPSSPRNRYELVIGPAPAFTLQRRVPPDEPDGEARWTDVDETLNLQTTARLRPKPVG